MNAFDVRVHAIRRRADRRHPFEVRWHAGGRARSRSFTTRRLADSYRAELVRAARMGQAFCPATGEPALWAAPQPPAVTWYSHAVTYMDARWPQLAAHSRASVADALATVTPALTRSAAHPPSAHALRTALYRHAFNPQRRASEPDAVTEAALAWLERASLPITDMYDTQVIRRALDALAVRTDGRPAAANTISRKRAVLHSTLGYAAELGLLPVNPLDRVSWKPPRSGSAVNPLIVASPAQVHAILTEVTRVKPHLTAFFACLYYAALRPEEAVALRGGDLLLPGHGWGQITLTRACPRTGSAWSATGQPYETRGLKHRPIGAVRIIPVPPVLVRLLRKHLTGSLSLSVTASGAPDRRHRHIPVRYASVTSPQSAPPQCRDDAWQQPHRDSRINVHAGQRPKAPVGG
jgi:integrase